MEYKEEGLLWIDVIVLKINNIYILISKNEKGYIYEICVIVRNKFGFGVFLEVVIVVFVGIFLIELLYVYLYVMLVKWKDVYVGIIFLVFFFGFWLFDCEVKWLLWIFGCRL